MSKIFTFQNDAITKRLSNPIMLISGDKSLEATAVWDTGATGSGISKEIVAKLELESPLISYISSANTQNIEVPVYLIDVVLNNDIRFDSVFACEIDTGTRGVDFIIGMDIISKGDFAISNYDGKTTFSFRTPSSGNIDFAEDDE